MYRFGSDTLLKWSVFGIAFVSGTVLLLIAVFLFSASAPALSNVGIERFVGDDSWHPKDKAAEGTFNLVPIVVGTALSSLGAILLAAPLGFLSAVYLQFYAQGWWRRWYRRMLDLMAGVPSVVYGLWGLVVLVPLIARIEPPGASLFCGVLILALMILPTVALFSLAALESVPQGYLRSASALGLSRSAVILKVAFPAAKSGLASAVILALARALGETMAILMVCGNVVQIPQSLFDPVRTLTGTMVMEMGYARGDHRSALFVCGLALLLSVAVLVWLADGLRSRREHARTV